MDSIPNEGELREEGDFSRKGGNFPYEVEFCGGGRFSDEEKFSAWRGGGNFLGKILSVGDFSWELFNHN